MSLIQLVNIKKEYKVGEETVQALKGINLEIKKGEFVAIMGPSGSGKSTTMHIIGALDIPSSGDYLLNGTNVSQMTEEELAKVRNEEIGFVFQAFNLLPRLSVLENVMIPFAYAKVPKAEQLKRAQEAIANVGKHAHASQAWVSVRKSRGSVVLEVEDDGCGLGERALSGAIASGRLGLQGIRERAAFLGGESVIDSEPGEGTRIRVRIPLAAASVAGGAR